jgi:hypothetical protein
MRVNAKYIKLKWRSCRKTPSCGQEYVKYSFVKNLCLLPLVFHAFSWLRQLPQKFKITLPRPFNCFNSLKKKPSLLYGQRVILCSKS